MPSLNAMTPQQEVFVQEYLVDLNATQAAIRAGYPPARAGQAATIIMKHPPVRDQIAKLMAARSRRVGINADRVLQKLGTIINGDPRSMFTDSGGLKQPTEMDKDDALMLAGVKTRRIVAMGEDGKMQPEEITEIKFVDPLSALSLAMRHLGMMNDKLDINVTHDLATRLAAAYKRTAGRGKTIDAETIENDVTSALMQLEQESSELQSQLVQQATIETEYETVQTEDHIDMSDFF